VWFAEAPSLNFLTDVVYFIRIQDINSEILEGCETQLSLGACVSMMMTFHNHTDCKFEVLCTSENTPHLICLPVPLKELFWYAVKKMAHILKA
jgi:hypothetical protein